MITQNVVWAVNVALECAIVSSIIFRGGHTHFLTFSLYITTGLLESVVLLAFRGHKAAYLWTYWAFEVVCMVLLAAVLQDIFERLLPTDSFLFRAAKVAFYGLCICAMCVGVFVATSDVGGGIGPVNAFGLRSRQGLRLVQCCMVAFIVLYTAICRPIWDNSAVRLFLGTSFLVCVELVLANRSLTAGASTVVAFKILNQLAYTPVFLIWLSAVLNLSSQSANQASSALVSIQNRLAAVVGR